MSETITPAWAPWLFIDLVPGAAQLVLVGGEKYAERALALNLDAPTQHGGTVRAALLRALGAEQRDAAPSAPLSVPVLVSVAPAAITLNLDMAGLREIGNSRGTMTVRRDDAGFITGMDSTGASVSDTIRRESA